MFRRVLNNKIGNILAYIAAQTEPLYMTKAIKLLYLIDEKAVRLTGSPITWLDYKVWKNGPVPSEIYYELKFDQVMTYGNSRVSLSDFINVQRKPNSKQPDQMDVKITPKKNYDFSDFSDFEMGVVKSVVTDYGYMNAIQLIDLLHQQDTRWHYIVTKFNLEEHFKLRGNTSDYTIDFIDLIEDDEFLKISAQAAYESLTFQENLLNTPVTFSL